jgi:hypothetical protein
MSVRAALGILVATAAVAHAQPKQPPDPTVSCAFVEIWASSGPASIDPAIPKNLAKKLGKVKQWTSYKQLSQVTRTLEKKKEEKLKLAKGTAQVTFVEIVDSTKVRLAVEFESPAGKASQKQLVDAADWVTTAVQQPNGEGHLLAGSCK